jgi:hypothetical protein
MLQNIIIGGAIIIALIGLLIFFAPATAPAPVAPAPVAPAPATAPAPVAPAPVAPAPVAPATAAPSPVAPAPVAPSPTAPSPTAPSPTAPTPVPTPTPTPAPSVSPIYSDWTAWSSCKLPQGANCGSGMRSRTRRCISGNCGELSQTLECNVECTAPSTRLSSMSFYINSNKWEYLRPITNEIVELDFKVEDMKVILKDGTSTLIEGIENIVWVEENNELKMKSPDNREFIVIRKKNEDLEIDLIPVSIKMLIYKKGRLIDNWYCNEESYPVRYRNGQLECIGTEGQRCFPQDPDICPSFVNRLNTELQYNKDMFDPNMYAQKVRLYSELTST